MPTPDPFGCGGPGQKPCPPTPATTVNEQPLFTLQQIHEYGDLCYAKGKADTAKASL